MSTENHHQNAIDYSKKYGLDIIQSERYSQQAGQWVHESSGRGFVGIECEWALFSDGTIASWEGYGTVCSCGEGEIPENARPIYVLGPNTRYDPDGVEKVIKEMLRQMWMVSEEACCDLESQYSAERQYVERKYVERKYAAESVLYDLISEYGLLNSNTKVEEIFPTLLELLVKDGYEAILEVCDKLSEISPKVPHTAYNGVIFVTRGVYIDWINKIRGGMTPEEAAKVIPFAWARKILAPKK